MLGDLRAQLVHHAQEMAALGLTDGSSGNLSLRDPETGLIVITPSAVPYSRMTPDLVPVVSLEGERRWGIGSPSSELAMHLSVYRAAGHLQAAFHTHSRFAIALACVHQPLPAITTDMAAYCGALAPLLPYRQPGSQELGAVVAEEVGRGTIAMLLANHGALVVGQDGETTLQAAMVLEVAAAAYIRGSLVGTPVPLTPQAVEERFQKIHGPQKGAL